MRIAIPTKAPGGLESSRSEHFGHCDSFTVIDIDRESAERCEIIPNNGHEAGDCAGPVNILSQKGVEGVVVEGLGKRPMQKFAEAGITVYYASNRQVPDVRAVIEKMSSTGLPIMQPGQVCQGGSNCHH